MNAKTYLTYDYSSDNGKVISKMTREELINGIPFIRNEVLKPQENATNRLIEDINIQANALILWGGHNSVLSVHPGWGGNNAEQNFFLGDIGGELKLKYISGKTDVIPLVFGYNLWWRDIMVANHRPFTSDQKMLSLLNKVLCVANGTKIFENPRAEYLIRIKLRHETLESIEFIDNDQKTGYPVFMGLTFESPKGEVEKNSSKYSVVESVAKSDLAQWFDTHSIRSEEPYPESCRTALASLQKALYTTPDDINYELIGTASRQIKKTEKAPAITFSGSEEAEILTHVFNDNLAETRRRYDVTGIVQESSPTADYYDGPGTWWPERKAFYGKAYTRNRSLITLAAAGFMEDVERAVDYYDYWLMYFPMAWPQVQLDGKPVPGHCPVVANTPHYYFDELTAHQCWPTKLTSRDLGNQEDDGHGMLMLCRYRTWLKTQKSPQWVHKHWKALKEAADYIGWAIDNPKLTFSEQGLLYNESEGGMQIHSLYCNIPCCFGLTAYAQMAESVGYDNDAQRWRSRAVQMEESIEKYYPIEIEPWGDVWDPAKTASWFYNQGVLAPVIFAADRYGYDALEFLPNEWVERTKRSYYMVRNKLSVPYCAPAGLGYGQNYFSQASLLYDLTEDANNFIRLLAHYCFAPRLSDPFRVPEGITLNEDGTVWRRWGDLGNLYQMNATVMTVMTMAGVDDVDPEVLKLIPRLPAVVSKMKISGYPIITESNGISQKMNLEMNYEIDRDKNHIRARIIFDNTVDRCKIRMGPFPQNIRKIDIEINNQKSQNPELISSGDSKWTWIVLADTYIEKFDISVHGIR